MHRIALSGLVALGAVLGGVVVIPSTAMAQPVTAVAQLTAGPSRPIGGPVSEEGAPAISCVLATDCLGIEGAAGNVGGAGGDATGPVQAVPSRPGAARARSQA